MTSSIYEWVSEVAQSCPTLCNPMDCSLPGSSLHGILQARVLEWVAISFSRGSSWPRDWTQVSRIPGKRFNLWATREAHQYIILSNLKYIFWPSLVVVWIRICLPMQGTWAQSPVHEASTCFGANKLMSHNYRARMPQVMKPAYLKPVHWDKRSHRTEKSAHRNKE